MSKVFNALSTILSKPTSFNVIDCVERSANGKVRFVVKLRTSTEGAIVDGFPTEGSQLTLYVSTTGAMEGAHTINPENWDYSISEFPHPDTGEVLSLKWLKASA